MDRLLVCLFCLSLLLLEGGAVVAAIQNDASTGGVMALVGLMLLIDSIIVALATDE